MSAWDPHEQEKPSWVNTELDPTVGVVSLAMTATSNLSGGCAVLPLTDSYLLSVLHCGCKADACQRSTNKW